MKSNTGIAKKFLIFTLAIILMAATVGCFAAVDADQPSGPDGETKPGSENSQQPIEASNDGYVFEYQQIEIVMHAPVTPVRDKLGEELSYFEAESCAFEGLDKTYSYPGFDLLTYPIEDQDYVAAVIFLDDSVTTPEGLYIGAEEADVAALQGDDYTMSTSGIYTYEKDTSRLQIIVKEGEVVSIEYLAITD